MFAENLSTKANDSGASSSLRRYQAIGHVVATAFVVGVLLFAAGLKVHSSLVSNSDGHRALPLVIALGEILLSILLLVKRTRNLSWIAAGCLFASFAAFNTYQTLQDVVECGCFGAIQIDPRTALLIDLSALTLILGFPPRTTGGVFSQIFKIMPRVRVGAAVLTLSGCVAIGVYRTNTPSILLSTDNWVGQPLPIATLLDASDVLAIGEWQLWIVNPSCSQCRDVIAELTASTLLSRTTARTALVVVGAEVDDDDIGQIAFYRPDIVVIHLRGPLSFHKPLPLRISCVDGYVVAVHEDMRHGF